MRGVGGRGTCRKARGKQVSSRRRLPLEHLASMTLRARFHPREEAGSGDGNGRTEADPEDAAHDDGDDNTEAGSDQARLRAP